MKFIHLADLHIGKRVNDFPMIEDQRFILEQITEIIREESPQAVLIAGDVYDKPVPPQEAVQLFDDFISGLADMNTRVLIISGNHDSAERLSFGSRIMDKRGIHFSGVYDGSVQKVELKDEYGTVNFYMLPFIKPVHVRSVVDDPEEIRTFTDAVSAAVSRMEVDDNARNVLIAHQFVTGGQTSESEEVSVGGLDNVDAFVFEPFDYTALGHLHGPQDITSTAQGKRIRYAGSPLKYSFSEASQVKTVTIVEMGEKAEGKCTVDIRERELEPYRDMKVLKGTFIDLTDNNYYKQLKTDDYMRIILTDENDVIGALASLRGIYPNIMRLDYDNSRTREAMILPGADDADARTPLEIFSELYENQNNSPMDSEQSDLVASLIEKVWSESL